MIELIIIVTFLGIILSIRRKIGIGNPFQIYFSMWFLVVLGYYIFRHSFVETSTAFITTLIVPKLLAFLLLFLIYFQYNQAKQFTNTQLVSINKQQDWCVLLALIGIAIALPYVYLKAIALADGHNIFSVIGYIKLRSAISLDNKNFGLLEYFFVPAYVVSSITMFSYLQEVLHFLRLALSVFVSLSYYLSTGRTFIVFFACLIVIPLVISGTIKIKGIFISISIIVGF